MATSQFDQGPWARTEVSYPPRPGNSLRILIDGQAAYGDIAAAFKQARQFIYLTICYGEPDFLPVPATMETFFDILRSRRQQGVDVRMVIWQPSFTLPGTLPMGEAIAGVNEGANSIQARWDRSMGYMGWYFSPRGNLRPFFLYFPARLGCQHQKTYVMDDGAGGLVAFVGGINPAQSYWDTPRHDMLDVRRVARGMDLLRGLEEIPPMHDIFYQIRGPAAGDVLANFVERYNGASTRLASVTTDVAAPVSAEQIPPVPGGSRGAGAADHCSGQLSPSLSGLDETAHALGAAPARSLTVSGNQLRRQGHQGILFECPDGSRGGESGIYRESIFFRLWYYA